LSSYIVQKRTWNFWLPLRPILHVHVPGSLSSEQRKKPQFFIKWWYFPFLCTKVHKKPQVLEQTLVLCILCCVHAMCCLETLLMRLRRQDRYMSQRRNLGNAKSSNMVAWNSNQVLILFHVWI
jgi:hypothetical protein